MTNNKIIIVLIYPIYLNFMCVDKKNIINLWMLYDGKKVL